MPRRPERPRLRFVLSASVAWGHLFDDPVRMVELATRVFPWRRPRLTARLQHVQVGRPPVLKADERAVLDGSALADAPRRPVRVAGRSPVRTDRQGSPQAPARTKVLHVVTNSLPHVHAGYTVRTHQTVRAQRAAGLRAEVVTALGFPVAQGRWRSADLDVIDGVPYHRLLPRWLPRDQGARLRAGVEAVSGLVERLQPDVVHAATDHRNGQVALAVAARYGLPAVYEVRGFLEESWLSRSPDRTPQDDAFRLARDAETRCMQGADVVVTLGPTMRDEIVSRGVDPDRVLLVPNAVHPQFLQPRRDCADLRRELGITADELVVGTVSTLYSYEGVAVLLEALTVGDRRVRAVVVGDGPERALLEERAAQLGVEDRVTFTGRVPFEATPRYHALLDVFVVPRLDERVCRLVTPLKPVEALACGTPLVVSDLPALRELVTPGETGLQVPPGDAPALAEALDELRDPDLRKKMGTAAHESVTGRTWDANVARYVEAYGLAAARAR